MKKRIRYIINPKSGVAKKTDFASLIAGLTDKEKFDYDITWTKAPKHATELSKEAAEKNYDIVVAVGGDGSVNEVAKGLLGTNTALGIIPTGSGNGMARHLKIPLKYSEAIKTINKGKREIIDTVRVNDEFCISTLGIGFDAHIAHLFANAGSRGFSTYAKLVLREFHKYQPKVYYIAVDGKSFSKECFLLTVANSSQFGNDAAIAPFADVKDGILDITMMSKFPLIAAPFLAYQLMKKNIYKSKYFAMTRGKEIIVRNNAILQGHIDGEPVTFNSDLNVKVLPNSLNVIVA